MPLRGLEEAQAGIKIAKRNINNPRYADDTTLMVESEEDLKSLLMKVKGESEKGGLNPRFPGPLLRRTRGPDPSSKATLWVKAQHEGALPPPCIVRTDPRVPHTARRGA